MEAISRLWAPLLAAVIFAGVWIGLWVFAPVDGCYTEDQDTSDVISYWPFLAAVVAGFVARRDGRSVWAIVLYAIGAFLLATVLVFGATLLWFMVNNCAISDR